MKWGLFLFLVSLTAVSFADEMKVVGEGMNCPSNIKIQAIEGSDSIYVIEGSKKTKLTSTDSSAFDKDAMGAVEFKSADGKYSYTQPSMVDGNPPKLHFVTNGKQQTCKINIK